MKFAIHKIAQNFLTNSCATSINTFWEKFIGEKISYIGFNFENGEITSVKIYLAVFTNTISVKEFPISPLYSKFEENLSNKSHLVTEKFANGGGITFSIKLKKGHEHLEYGYYMRCKQLTSQESMLVNKLFKPFDAPILTDSLGIYNTIFDGEQQTHVYGYTNPSDLFPETQKDYVNYEKIRGVELAKINNPEKLKYIYLGGEDVFKEVLLTQIPHEIISFKNAFALNFVCPAFNLKHKLCSVYLTDFSNNSMLPSIQLLTKF
ncbi:MAG: hypothetical protein ACK4Y6_05830 [Bacteroidota bacterium]